MGAFASTHVIRSRSQALTFAPFVGTTPVSVVGVVQHRVRKSRDPRPEFAPTLALLMMRRRNHAFRSSPRMGACSKPDHLLFRPCAVFDS